MKQSPLAAGADIIAAAEATVGFSNVGLITEGDKRVGPKTRGVSAAGGCSAGAVLAGAVAARFGSVLESPFIGTAGVEKKAGGKYCVGGCCAAICGGCKMQAAGGTGSIEPTHLDAAASTSVSIRGEGSAVGGPARSSLRRPWSCPRSFPKGSSVEEAAP